MGRLAGIIGHRETPDEIADAELRALRVAAARACRAWMEITDDLVARPLGLLVSASSTEAYRVYRGATFFGCRIEFAVDRPLAFVVRGGDVLVLEPLEQTWSEILEQRLRRQDAKAAT